MPDESLAHLNQAQRSAAEAVRGPVCILAGAGSGKTTTITARIAHQVASGTFTPEEVLAVTFTDKAAREMATRLSRLGVTGVRARTFHSAALAQLRFLHEEPPGSILPSKVLALRQLANRLPAPYKFRPAADLATEIEWAKNRRIGPDRYGADLGEHEPPIPTDLMQRIYREYERGKSDRGLIDFEDVLELTVRMYDRDEYARERMHARYTSFTVDEFQDVNLLQFELLKRWLGPRDDICAVGDDYQSIYGFTGASPRYLLELPKRFVGTKVVRLEENYRSTPEILDFANRLVPQLGGAEKVLKATRAEGPKPEVHAFADDEAEATFIAARVAALHEEGIPLEEMAILYRTNFRSEDFEEALSAARIPFQVRDGAFLTRQAARRLLSVIKRSSGTGVAAEVLKAARSAGWVEEPPDGLGEQELTRQNDLARLVRLAEEFDDGARTSGEFVADLQARFTTEGEGRGVNLLTYHRAKGLEFDAVFLPRLNEGEMPFKRSRSDDAIAEERRLLYVGITRARSHLEVSWVMGRAKPSRFVGELSVYARPEGAAAKSVPSEASQALRRWRLERAKTAGVPAYVVLHDSTLEEIARRRPATHDQLAQVPGIGPLKLQGYGDEILATLAALAGKN